MRMWVLCLLAASLLTAARPDAQTEKEIRSMMEAYRQALLHKDAAALAPLLSDDLTYTHSSNLHQDKPAVLASMKGKPADAIDFNNLSIRVYGNTAVVTTDLETRTSNAGTVSVTKLHVLHVLVKGAEGWQVVARQATHFPEPVDGKK